MSNGVPSGALPASIAVIVYTTISLLLSSLLFYLLITHERRITYVLMVSIFVSIGTLASLIQQIHFAVDFRRIREATFKTRQQAHQDAGAAISNGTAGADLILFWIQFYTYNVNGLLILFWAVTLFQGTWRINFARSWNSGLLNHIETISKVVAVVLPGFLIGIANIAVLRAHNIAFAILCNACLVLSTSTGSVLLVFTLWKFVQSRRNLNGSSLGSNQRSYGVNSSNSPQSNAKKRSQRAVDRSIILRFSIAFVILSVFDIVNIIFQVNSLNAASAPTTTTTPDFSTSNAISSILQFIPGVLCSPVAWAIWGTTKSFLASTKDLLTCASCRSSLGRRKSLLDGSTDSGMDGTGSTVRLRGEDGFKRLGSPQVTSGRPRMTSKNDIMVETELRHETELRDYPEGKDQGRTMGLGPEEDEWPRSHRVEITRVEISRA